jgi:hypothetical protein
MAGHIIYREIPPHQALSPFIDAYWTVTGDNTGYLPDKVLPDACVDIILNVGPGFASEIGARQMDTGQAYLIGTMTRFKEMIRPPATRLIGIRFKPGGFPFFYDHQLLKDTADKAVDLVSIRQKDGYRSASWQNEATSPPVSSSGFSACIWISARRNSST